MGTKLLGSQVIFAMMVEQVWNCKPEQVTEASSGFYLRSVEPADKDNKNFI